MKKFIAMLLAASMILSMIVLSVSAETAETEAADMILTNGVIYTMVSEGDTAEAVAVKGGEIVFVGSAEEAEAYVGENTEVIDLAGKTVLPGFIDGHTHPGSRSAIPAIYLDQTEPDIEVYKEVVKNFLVENADYEFVCIYGTGINLNAFENGVPTNEWLDEVCPDIPVCIRDVSYHGVLLNSKAIEICGLTKDSEPDLNGIIYKDANGELTGFISDCHSYTDKLPVEEEDIEAVYADSIRDYQTEANSYGITSIDHGGTGSAADINVFRKVIDDMYKSGDLTLRINLPAFADKPFTAEEAVIQIAALDEGQQYNSDFQNVTQVKCSIDGVPEACTSALMEPYAETSGQAADYTGPEITAQEDFNEFVAAVNAAGYQVNTHSMGDLSVRTAVEATEYSIAQNGEGDYRNIITHVNLLKEEDIQRMANDKIYAAMQPVWWYFDPVFSPLEKMTLGDERFATEYKIANLVNAGIKITGSCDYPITLDFRPLAGIQVAVTLSSPYEGEEDDPQYVRFEDQAVSVYEAVKMYTVYGAEQMKMEDRIGTIETSKKADLVVLGTDIFTCDVKDIADTEVVYTVSDGRIVFDSTKAE